MKRIACIFLLLAVISWSVPAQSWTARFDPNSMRARVKRLSADDFEGRGPGTEGGKRSAQYIADQLKASGVLPANSGSYFQNVKLVGVKADPRTSLVVRGKAGLQSYSFGNDFVATTGSQTGEVGVDSELVFLGYGIDAPSYNWNDYKGNADQYKGKVLMIMVNDPPATEKEPNLFGGKALTYYGRWTYKYEEAARKGAAGVILIHSDGSAGYGWNVVRTSNGNWRYEIARSPSDSSPFLSLKSWVTESTARNILKEAGMNLDQMREMAKSRDFRPVATGLSVKLNLKSELKTFDSPNVVGKVEGSDPGLNKEFVVFSAHWDHLGIGEPNDKGDRIYNGAYDNASGVAAVLGIAEVLAKTPRSQRPKRSFFFLFPTAEEQGLLGAEYYSQHPLVPLSKTVADINLDGVNFFGKVSDMMALGSERSTIEVPLASAARERNLTLQSDTRPEQGFFFRSDHFPFAKVGVPSINLQHGESFIKPLTAEAEGFFKDYNAKYYHQVTDEYHDWWDMSAMIQEAEFALAVGAKIANTVVRPKFNSSDEFAAADQKRFK